MKICVFADIHGNMDAFNKMYEEEKDNVELFLFAGDIFGYFYEQEAILEKFMAMEDLVAVKGNHEKYYLTGQDAEKLLDKYGSSYKLAVTEEQRKYLEKLPENVRFRIGDKLIGVFHGGPKNFLEQRIYPDSDTEIEQLNEGYDYLILAHTHYGLLKKVGKTTVINPGSLGQPRDGKGFRYCVLDTDTGSCIFKSVTLEIKQLLENVKKKDGDKYVYHYLKNKYGREEIG